MILLCAALSAGAAALWLPASVGSRLDDVVRGSRSRPVPPRPRPSRSVMTWTSAAIAAAGAWLVIGGIPGAVVAAIVAVVVTRVVGRLETAGGRRSREELERQAPMAAELVAATMAAGAPWTSAIRAVSDALGDPTSSALRPVLAAFELGAPAVDAWSGAPAELAPVAEAVSRSVETGAPLQAMLVRIADDMRRDRRRAVEVAARSAGVRSVAPLASCFLPAFLLLGVVPVVASLATALLSG